MTKIAISGAAGLIEQNLIPRFKTRRYVETVAIDKHVDNPASLRELHPDGVRG